MSLWGDVRQTVGNWADSLGTAVGLPETGKSEWIAGGPTVNTKLGGQGMASAYEGAQSPAPNSSQLPPGIYNEQGQKIGSSDKVVFTKTPSGGSTTTTTTGGGNGGGGGDNSRLNELRGLAAKGDLNPSQKTELEQMEELIRNSAGEQQGGAQAAAEARRKAAEAKYNAQVGIAQEAKGMAKDAYDWLVDAIGSNKQDLLEQVALQEKKGEADYAMQDDKTRRDYDRAKQDILSTYRDLQAQQEKLLRGSGMGSSSRSQEASLKLSNLLGKDMSTVRTNEADSLAMIGNALGAFRDGIRQTNVSIEREAGTKLDKAALDYNSQIKAIDANLTLSAAEREEAYAQAEAQLATDSQAIQQWATGLKVQAQQTQMAMQNKLDDFVADMLDENAGLNTGLTEKRAKTNEVLTAMGFTPLDENSATDNPTVGVYQGNAKMSYKDKNALDAALARGEIDQAAYQSQLSKLQLNSGTGGSAMSQGNQATSALASINANQNTNPRAQTAQRDPLLAALFA